MHFSGKIIHGFKIGRKLGFPTANIKIKDNNIEKGVFAVIVTINNKKYKGMLFVGSRETLNIPELTIEIYIFNFNDYIYDFQIDFDILKKIRDVIKFENKALLVEQIKKDKNEIEQFLSTYSL